MQSNLSISASQTNFKAQVSNKFIKTAHNFYQGIGKNKDKLRKFDEKVQLLREWGYDDYYIKYVKKDANGKRKHMLIAVKNGMEDWQGAVLTSKDMFRKVAEKFCYMNKCEFTTKMKEHHQKMFPLIKPE